MFVDILGQKCFVSYNVNSKLGLMINILLILNSGLELLTLFPIKVNSKLGLTINILLNLVCYSGLELFSLFPIIEESFNLIKKSSSIT